MHTRDTCWRCETAGSARVSRSPAQENKMPLDLAFLTPGKDTYSRSVSLQEATRAGTRCLVSRLFVRWIASAILRSQMYKPVQSVSGSANSSRNDLQECPKWSLLSLLFLFVIRESHVSPRVSPIDVQSSFKLRARCA